MLFCVCEESRQVNRGGVFDLCVVFDFFFLCYLGLGGGMRFESGGVVQ